MTTSESQCRIWIKKTYPNALIFKYPDYKQTNLHHSSGIPDFLVIDIDNIFFVECKTWKNKTLTSAQKYMFAQLLLKNVQIYIWIKKKRGFECVLYK